MSDKNSFESKIGTTCVCQYIKVCYEHKTWPEKRNLDCLFDKPNRVLNIAYPDTEFSEHNGSYFGSSNLALFFVERSSTPSPAKNE